MNDHVYFKMKRPGYVWESTSDFPGAILLRLEEGVIYKCRRISEITARAIPEECIDVLSNVDYLLVMKEQKAVGLPKRPR